MFKRFLCWLNGHKMIPITDPVEIRFWIANWEETRRLVMVKCGRCGKPITGD
jgi:uncharacterized OB-fold protein